MRCGEGMVHRPQRSAGRILLKQGKVNDPGEAVVPLSDQIQSPPHLLAHPVQYRTGNPVRTSTEQAEITILQTQPGDAVRTEELCRRSFQRPPCDLEPEQSC